MLKLQVRKFCLSFKNNNRIHYINCEIPKFLLIFSPSSFEFLLVRKKKTHTHNYPKITYLKQYLCKYFHQDTNKEQYVPLSTVSIQKGHINKTLLSLNKCKCNMFLTYLPFHLNCKYDNYNSNNCIFTNRIVSFSL